METEKDEIISLCKLSAKVMKERELGRERDKEWIN